MTTPQRIIEEVLREKLTKKDRFGRDYLLLKLDNDEAIFVFPGRVPTSEWTKLTEGKKYSFVVEPGQNGNSNLLLSFEAEGEIIFI